MSEQQSVEDTWPETGSSLNLYSVAKSCNYNIRLHKKTKRMFSPVSSGKSWRATWLITESQFLVGGWTGSSLEEVELFMLHASLRCFLIGSEVTTVDERVNFDREPFGTMGEPFLQKLISPSESRVICIKSNIFANFSAHRLTLCAHLTIFYKTLKADSS